MLIPCFGRVVVGDVGEIVVLERSVSVSLVVNELVCVCVPSGYSVVKFRSLQGSPQLLPKCVATGQSASKCIEAKQSPPISDATRQSEKMARKMTAPRLLHVLQRCAVWPASEHQHDIILYNVRYSIIVLIKYPRM